MISTFVLAKICNIVHVFDANIINCSSKHMGKRRVWLVKCNLLYQASIFITNNNKKKVQTIPIVNILGMALQRKTTFQNKTPSKVLKNRKTVIVMINRVQYI